MGSPATKDYLRAWERRVVDAIMIGLGRGCKLVWGVDSIWGLRIPHHHPLVPSPDNSGIDQCIGEVWNHVTLQTDSAASRCFSFSASALKPRVSCWLKEPYTFDQLQESWHSPKRFLPCCDTAKVKCNCSTTMVPRLLLPPRVRPMHATPT